MARTHKLYRLAADAARNVAGYHNGERASIRIAADYVHSARCAMERGDLDGFLTCVRLAGEFANQARHTDTAARFPANDGEAV